MAQTEHFAKSAWMLTLTSLAMVVAVLYFAQGVLIPLTLALLLSFMLSPVCDWLERYRLPRIPSVLLVASTAFAGIGVGAWTASRQILELTPRLPEYQSNIQTRMNLVNAYLSGALGGVRAALRDSDQASPPSPAADANAAPAEIPALVRVVTTQQSPIAVIVSMFGPALVVTGSTGIVIVLVVFFLCRREDLRDRFIRLAGQGQVTLTTRALEDATNRVSRFLLMQLLINVAFGIAVTIGLYFIGVPSAALWGILATVLRFIPFVGPWAAAAAPIGLSLAISSGWAAPLLTIGLFVLIELLSNNVLEPWLYGKNTGISAVALLVAAVFWSWLWGIAGLLLSTPLAVCLLVIGRHVPQLAFLDTLLGNEPVFELKRRIYQRLLAGDPEEATELLLDDLKTQTLARVYDAALLPALVMTETHWRRGELDENRYKFIFQSMRTSIEELSDRRHVIQAKLDAAPQVQVAGGTSNAAATDPPELCVLCLPANDESDEIAGLMLAQLVELPNCRTRVVSASAPLTDRVELVSETRPSLVCISATPPAAAMHARYLYRRLRGHLPDAQVIVGLWDTTGDLNHLRDRIGCGPETHVVASLGEASERIRRLVLSAPGVAECAAVH